MESVTYLQRLRRHARESREAALELERSIAERMLRAPRDVSTAELQMSLQLLQIADSAVSVYMDEVWRLSDAACVRAQRVRSKQVKTGDWWLEPHRRSR